jgi:Xaa-Pro aminopeptidase
MFQSFTDAARRDQGPARLKTLRDLMAREHLSGFLIPRADAHQGEYVAPRDERLQWLTGFTGSAGFCAALQDRAGVFIDGRYRTQVKSQVDTAHFTPVPWPETKLGPWLREALPEGGTVAYDPWLHTPDQISEAETALQGSGVSLQPTPNLVDRIWPDQPAPPRGKVIAYPDDLAGETHASKRTRLAAMLRTLGQKSAVITLPDCLAWLLNIRGSDIAKNPLPHGFAILHDTGHLTLFMAPEKLTPEVKAHLGSEITIRPVEAFIPALHTLQGPVRVDRGSAPILVVQELEEAGIAWVAGQDPCLLPKAAKNPAEIAATREAHLRDGAAMCEFLTWFDAQPVGSLTEIDVVTALEGYRRATNALLDISFDTIAGTGEHGAIMHYRVTETTNKRLEDGHLIVVDSGGQYIDGTTDITRTLPVGQPSDEARTQFTRVLQGMIGISRLRFPKGLAGRDIDAIARFPLWVAGQDFDHGTGHGVGVYLCVHEGPQRISRVSEIPLQPGMILSNEPGYYREGAFGIRLENLIVVEDAPKLEGADNRVQYAFETLTWVPIDLRLIRPEMLSPDEKLWINQYHRLCRDRIGPRLSDAARVWLEQSTRAL